MRNYHIEFILTTFVLLFILACKGDDMVIADAEAPVITVLSPSVNGIFQNGDTLPITITIIDNQDLKSFSAGLQRTQNGNVVEVWSIQETAQNPNYNLSYGYLIQDNGMNKEFVLTVTAIDRNDNISSVEVPFQATI